MLAYRVSGSPAAPPLILLHALGESAADGDTVAADPGTRWRVYAVDLRGHGRGGRPTHPVRYRTPPDGQPAAFLSAVRAFLAGSGMVDR